jgi:HNH endonuclease
MRTCVKCHEAKPTEEYAQDKTGRRRTNCTACDRERCRLRVKSLDARGMCVTCGRDRQREGRRYCERCSEQKSVYAANRKRKLKSGSICYKCAKAQAVIKDGRCQRCMLRLRANALWKNYDRGQDLQDLWDAQRGICPYTGIAMASTLEAEIDHAIPKSSGGSNDIGNLQFVLKEVNRMKFSLGESDFLRLVKTVYRHCVKTGKIVEVDESLVPFRPRNSDAGIAHGAKLLASLGA